MFLSEYEHNAGKYINDLHLYMMLCSEIHLPETQSLFFFIFFVKRTGEKNRSKNTCRLI